MAAEGTRSISVVPSDESVAEARRFAVDTALVLAWFDAQRTEELELLVSEVVTNAVRAQERAAVIDAIEVECTAVADRFELVVRDRAGGFELDGRLTVPEPTLSREGGFGLAIIVSLSDEAEFRPYGAGTEVRLILRPRDGGTETVRTPRPG